MTATVTKATPLPLRNDTILGVCEAIGQDFGFNALWLRLLFIAPLFVQPMLTVGVYLALGLVVAASRYAFPRTVGHAELPALEAASEEPGEQLPLAA